MVAVGPVSTIFAAYMTLTESQTSAITDRSWEISTMDSSSWSVRLRSSARICAWVMTSRAVIGSSATISCGRQASAIAIRTRWRMPPDSSCGKLPARPGSMPTLSSSSRTRRRASAAEVPGSWARIGSAIWAPMECTGLSEFMAPWKMTAIRRQRTARSSLSVMARTSAPSKVTEPAVTAASRASSRGMARARVVLPQPDSPASPATWPVSTDRDAPSTATTGPRGVAYSTRRSAISSRLTATPAASG
jgi:hypothetical protein